MALLNPDETFTLCMMQGEMFSGYLLTQEDGKPVTLTVVTDKASVSLNTKGTPKVTVKVDLMVRLYNRSIPVEMEDVAREDISDELIANAKATVEEMVKKVFQTSRESECDLFQLNQSLYRSSKKKYEEWKDLISAAPVTYEIKIKTTK